ncbi:MAG: SHOCT domain-containing protein [Acutalibacteraceae bacterium]
MAIKTANTAVGTAMLLPAEKQRDDLQARLLRYRTSTTVFRSMVKNGILTENDYKKCCDILAEKYGISLCSIFR